MASYHGVKDAISVLKECNADMNLGNIDGESPLFIAVESGQKEIVQVLLANGANHSTPNNAGVKPVDLAQKFGLAEIVQILVDAGAEKPVIANKKEGSGKCVIC
jgi:ankyrin repeat protein